MENNKPNLFFVGFDKCGTSTLAQMLCDHPENKSCGEKEIYCYDNKIYEKSDMYPFSKTVSVLGKQNTFVGKRE